MDKKNLISYEQAKALSKLGFPQNGYTTPIYVNTNKVEMCTPEGHSCVKVKKGELIIPNIKTFDNEPYYVGLSKKDLYCHTLFETEQWLRTSMNIHMFISPSRTDSVTNIVHYHFNGFLFPENDKLIPINGSNEDFKSKEDALSFAIDQIIAFINERNDKK